jgi:transcriptional regulator with XRE-family HTH domain
MGHIVVRKRVKGPFSSLRAFFDQAGALQVDVAKDAGISESHLSNIVNGRRTPGYDLAVRLSRLTNVPVESIGTHAA